MGNTHLPVGFIMAITQNKEALKYFSGLDEESKHKISKYIQDSNTGDQTRLRIETSINGLAKRNLHFLNQ